MPVEAQFTVSNQPLTVTAPFLPPLDEFIPLLEDIWASKWLTNNGKYHQTLERELAKYLGVEFVSLFSNGTLALVAALQTLRITGEVITTPYSFVATTHALWWNNIKPVFVDIEPRTFNIDPQKLEAAITPKTTAILPVHVYGNPCDVHKIKEIGDAYGLKVIYDACHTFGVRVDGVPVLNFGDLSIMSFHATKVFTTFEGGAIISHDEATKKRIDYLKNFGFVNETTVVTPGINAKMNEVQAAMGLLQLKYVDDCIRKRQKVANSYREALTGVEGISFLGDVPGVGHCYSYFPILIDSAKYGSSRDTLYESLKAHKIFGRRYFFPLISQFPSYRSLESAKAGNMPVAERVASQVICVPSHPGIGSDDLDRIVDVLCECRTR
jgi:dTDP-4-amino-4,6-dideoxygalactose transaminase